MGFCRKAFTIAAVVCVVSSALISAPAYAASQRLSKAAAYLVNEQIAVACRGRGGRIASESLIKRDLTGDGKDDLIIDHSGIRCNGPRLSSHECGKRACTVNFYVREGRLLKLKGQFLGMNVVVDGGQIPAIHTRGHEQSDGAVYWTGSDFEWKQNPPAVVAAASQPDAIANGSSVALGARFADYPSTDTLNSAARFPNFNGRDRDFREFRTRIRDGVSGGVNFAGHYSFITIGCGTSCQFGYVVDLRTGQVFNFPYGGEDQYQMNVRFAADSRLVRVRWKDSWDGDTCTEKDLLVEGTKWRTLDTRTVPTDDGLCYYHPDIPLEQFGSQAAPAQTAAAAPEPDDPVTSAAPAPATTAKAQGLGNDLKQRWLVTEQYLKTLGFDPGPVDGVVDAATVMAVGAFQKAYGLEELNKLPAEHFAVLEALAKANKSDASQAGSEPAAKAPQTTAAAPVKAGVQPPAAVPSSSGNSATPVRTEDNGVVYHKLGACEFEKGAAIANYNFRTQSAHPAELEITDLCFDRKSGKLWASEPEDRFTLVKKDEGFDWFEVIVPNTQPFERWRSTAGNYRRPSAQGYKNETVNFSYDRPSARYLNWRTTGTQHDADVTLSGYLLETQSAIDNLTSEFKVYVGGLDYWDHIRERGGKHLGRESPQVAFEGLMRFDGTTGTAELRNTVETGKDGTGKLVLTVDANGSLSGNGTISLSNARLAGVNQHDWKTTTWEIKKLVGHFAGKDGEEFRGVGIASGQTIDHDGFINPVLASVTFQGYSRRIAKRWENEASTGAQ